MPPAPDPSAAVQAYLALIPPSVRAQAQVLADWRHIQAIGSLVVVVLACWALARSGVLARTLKRIEGGRPRPWRTSLAACAVTGLVLAWALAFWRGICSWRVERLLGATPHPVLAHVFANLASPAGFALWIGLGAGAYALVRRFPRRAPVGIAVAAAAAAFALTYAPYALSLGSQGAPVLPEGPLRARILALAAETRLPLKQVYLSFEPVIEADVTGTPSAGRIVVTRRMLASEDLPESLANVGHVMGHYAHGDQLAYGALLAGLTLAVGLAVIALYGPAARLMGSGALSLSDPAGLPVLAAVLALGIALSGPVANGFIRRINVAADAYSLDHAREPDGLARHLVLTRAREKADAPAWEEALFLSHRPLKRRLEQAMAWKAAHPAQ
jgi:STE24 endopeptidase